MSKLPNGWLPLPISELGELKLGKMLDKSKNQGRPARYLRNINVRWFRFDLASLQELLASNDELAELSVEDGDLFICEGGEPGRCAVWRGGQTDLVYQKALHRFRTRGAVLPEFLMYRLRYEAELGTLSDAFTGTTIKHLTRESLSRLNIPVPPRPEQQRIVDKLTSLLARVDACSDRLDRVPTILKRFRQAVLSSATSGALTDDYRPGVGSDKSRREIHFGDDVLEVPASWDVVQISDVIDPRRPLCYGVVQPGDEVPTGAPLVRVQDMARHTVMVDQLRTVSVAVDQEYRRSRVRGGDVLVSVVGTIGRTAIVPDGLEANIARAIARISCRPDVAPNWIHTWLASPRVQWWMLNSSREVARKTLNLAELASIPVALPPPAEQAEIAARVHSLFALADAIEARYENARTHVERLTPALLAKAFRGVLVPQDPNDEPVSALLARLRGSPDAAAALPRKRGHRKVTPEPTA